MKNFRNMKRPRLTTIVASLALLVALGGTATAAGLINGGKIKPGTITGKKLKNKTLTQAKFAPAALNALKGSQGPRGEKGEQGPKGNTGIPGVAGPNAVNFFSLDDNTGNVPANTEVDVAAFNNMDSSKYLVIAKANIFSNNSGSFMRCSIETNNNGGGDEAQWTSPTNSSRNSVPLILATTGKVTQIKFGCQTGTSAGSFDVSAVAVPVG